MLDSNLMLVVAERICAQLELTLRGRVGAGAFKTTFEAAASNGSIHALKIYNIGSSNVRVEREVDAMARCSHPNIARFEKIDVIEIENVEYLYSLEEFIAGGDLETKLKGKLLTRSEVLEMGSHLISAVSHIASLDLVHRDLKPANIMLRSKLIDPVIVDFGLVRNLGEKSLTATWVPTGPGTPFFSSPEQLNNDKHLIDWRTDQFALGVLLTMSLINMHPFSNYDSGGNVAVDRVACRGALPGWFLDWVAKENLAPLARMVQPWPVQRYRSPSDLSHEWNALES